MQLVAHRARALISLARNPPLPRLLDGIAETSGLSQASIAQLAKMWLSTIDEEQVHRWLQAMAAGVRDPVGDVAVIAPGNLFVATWTAMLEPWLCGNTVRVRPGSGDRMSAANLATALCADGFEIHDFERADDQGWQRFFHQAAAVAVYGGDDAVTAVRALAKNHGFTGTFRGHGHKVSIGRLRADQCLKKARDIGLDAWLADGRGCMSLRALLVDAPEQLDSAWLTGLWEVAAEVPAGHLPLQQLAARRMVVEQAQVSAAMGEPITVYERGDVAVVVDARSRPQIKLSDVGPGARLLVVLRQAPIADDLRRHLARPAATAEDIGRLQAPPLWRDPDGYPTGAAFVSDPSSA